MRGVPLIGCDESGGTFNLLPEQVALAMVLARGPLASRLTEEVTLKRAREVAAAAAGGGGAAAEPAAAKGKGSRGKGKAAAGGGSGKQDGPPLAPWYSPPDGAHALPFG